MHICWCTFVSNLAHRNRSDFCDLRLRCPSRTPEIARFPRQEKAMLHCDLRLRWKVASDLRFRAAISEPKTPSFCGISGDLAQSTRKSLAIAIVRFWCTKVSNSLVGSLGGETFFPRKIHGKFCGKVSVRRRPGKRNQRKGQNEKFMNFAHFCEFWCFSLGEQARFTLNFCSGMPLRKVHDPDLPKIPVRRFFLYCDLLSQGKICLIALFLLFVA